MHDKPIPFISHLEELRKRLLFCFLALIVFSIFSYCFIDKVIGLISKNIKELIFISPTELFFARIKLSLLIGFFISSPLIAYQIWKFISIALYQKEKKFISYFAMSSFILFLLGASFSYFVVFPYGLKFLLKFSTESIKPMITVNNYISFLFLMLLGFGLIFQLPLIIVFLTKIRIVSPKILRAKRPYIIVLIFIVAAILTPPDVFTQFLMAIPLLVLYEVSILVSYLFYRK